MKNLANVGYNRVNNILLSDKKRATDEMLGDLIKSDIISVLSNYFILSEDLCSLCIEPCEDGRLVISMSIMALRGKQFCKV